MAAALKDAFKGIFDEVWIDLARQLARGTIEGLMDRYSVAILAEFIQQDRDIISAAFESPDPRDVVTLQKLRALASRYASKGPMIRAHVTSGWMLDWLRRRYPEAYVILNTTRGRSWFNTNFERMLNYFFPT